MEYKIQEPDFVENHTNTSPVFCDTEGEGLYTNIRLVQCYQPEWSKDVYFYDTDKIDESEIKEGLKPLHTVWWNAPYDFGALNMTSHKFDDLLKAVKIAYPEFQEYSLDIVAKKMGLDHYYDGLDKKKLQKAAFIKGAYLSYEQKRYASVDVLILAEIWKDAKVQDVIQNNLAYKVDMLSLQYCVQYQQNGMPIHRENLNKQIAENTKLVNEYQTKIDNYIQQRFKEVEADPDRTTIYTSTWKGKDLNKEWSLYDIFDRLRQQPFKVNSYQQVRLLFQSTESDAPFLLRMAGDGSDLADWILNRRRYGKQLSYMELVKPYKRMYTKFSPGGAATGRFKADGGNLKDGFNSQQIPRKLKHIFGVSEDSGKILIGADYATLELRLAAAIYKESEMYQKLMEGKDLHTETAKDMIGHDNWTKEDRQNAKPVNFGFTFGMGIGTFIEMAFNDYGLIFSEDKAKEFKQKFFKANPNIANYHNDIWNKMNNGGYVYRTALNRRTMPKLGTDAINGPVQGSGAEVTKLAIHYMCKEDPEAVTKIINVVHDSITLEVDNTEESIKYWSELLERNMVKGWTEISKCSIMHFKDIPMPVDVGTGFAYGDAS